MDKLEVSPRYARVVEEERRGKGFGNFVGLRCGLPIFDGGQEAVVHPATKEIVGYSGSVQIGFDKSDGSSRFCRRCVDNFSRRSDCLLEEGRWQNYLADIGSAGLKSAVLAGAAGGLLEWFDYPPETSLTGAAVGVAVGGLSLVHQRWKRKEKVRSYIEEFSDALSNMEKIAISTNLLAPDSFVDSDAQTGSADNRQARNVYLIGGVSVDQQQRFDSFWDQADEILEEYGFAEWQEYRTVGMPELIRRILEDVHNNCDLDSDHKERIIFKVRCFGDCRSGAIKNIKNLPKKLKSSELCQKYGIDEGDITDPDKLVTDKIKQTDQKYAEAFRDFIAGIKEVCTEAKKESVQDLLVRIYGGKSSLQGYFWGELSRALAENSIDPYDEAVAEPAQFIVDIPNMIPSGSEESSSEDKVCKLYEAFYKSYSEKYPGMLPPDEFISKISKDISLSKMRNLIYRIKHPQRIIFNI